MSFQRGVLPGIGFIGSGDSGYLTADQLSHLADPPVPPAPLADPPGAPASVTPYSYPPPLEAVTVEEALDGQVHSAFVQIFGPISITGLLYGIQGIWVARSHGNSYRTPDMADLTTPDHTHWWLTCLGPMPLAGYTAAQMSYVGAGVNSNIPPQLAGYNPLLLGLGAGFISPLPNLVAGTQGVPPTPAPLPLQDMVDGIMNGTLTPHQIAQLPQVYTQIISNLPPGGLTGTINVPGYGSQPANHILHGIQNVVNNIQNRNAVLRSMPHLASQLPVLTLPDLQGTLVRQGINVYLPATPTPTTGAPTVSTTTPTIPPHRPPLGVSFPPGGPPQVGGIPNPGATPTNPLGNLTGNVRLPPNVFVPSTYRPQDRMPQGIVSTTPTNSGVIGGTTIVPPPTPFTPGYFDRPGHTSYYHYTTDLQGFTATGFPPRPPSQAGFIYFGEGPIAAQDAMRARLIWGLPIMILRGQNPQPGVVVSNVPNWLMGLLTTPGSAGNGQAHIQIRHYTGMDPQHPISTHEYVIRTRLGRWVIERYMRIIASYNVVDRVTGGTPTFRSELVHVERPVMTVERPPVQPTPTATPAARNPPVVPPRPPTPIQRGTRWEARMAQGELLVEAMQRRVDIEERRYLNQVDRARELRNEFARRNELGLPGVEPFTPSPFDRWNGLEPRPGTSGSQQNTIYQDEQDALIRGHVWADLRGDDPLQWIWPTLNLVPLWMNIIPGPPAPFRQPDNPPPGPPPPQPQTPVITTTSGTLTLTSTTTVAWSNPVNLRIEVWSGGAGGGPIASSGGGGGGYALRVNFRVVPGVVYDAVVGTGGIGSNVAGTGGGGGGQSYFAGPGNCNAYGGTNIILGNGLGGQGTAGNVFKTGGNSISTAGAGGGAGSGTAGSDANGLLGGAGGTGDNPGGAGGGQAANGTVPGGGGGASSGGVVGNGARGQIIITWTPV